MNSIFKAIFRVNLSYQYQFLFTGDWSWGHILSISTSVQIPNQLNSYIWGCMCELYHVSISTSFKSQINSIPIHGLRSGSEGMVILCFPFPSPLLFKSQTNSVSYLWGGGWVMLCLHLHMCSNPKLTQILFMVGGVGVGLCFVSISTFLQIPNQFKCY